MPPPEDTEALGPEADAESVARRILLDALTGRARSREELRALLARKLVPNELAERLLERFTEVGLIDDVAFAEAWVLGRHQAKGLAPRALAVELRRKGIEDQVAKDALSLVDDDQQEASARDLVRRKRRSQSRLSMDVAARRLVGMLARKGYPAGLAHRVVREELALESEPEESV